MCVVLVHADSMAGKIREKAANNTPITREKAAKKAPKLAPLFNAPRAFAFNTAIQGRKMKNA